jgi:hypothetical protein
MSSSPKRSASSLNSKDPTLDTLECANWPTGHLATLVTTGRPCESSVGLLPLLPLEEVLAPLLPARRFLDAFLSKLLGLAFRREAKSKLFGFDPAGLLTGSSAAVVATQLAFLLSLLLALRMLRALRSHGHPNRGQEDHQDSCDVFDPPHR